MSAALANEFEPGLRLRVTTQAHFNPRFPLALVGPPAKSRVIPMPSTKSIERAFRLARERYAALSVDVDRALKALAKIPVSLHCWQGDDVGGFENFRGALGGGLVSTGNYPGKARTPDELRADFDKAFSFIPGKHRVNLHAMY